MLSWLSGLPQKSHGGFCGKRSGGRIRSCGKRSAPQTQTVVRAEIGLPRRCVSFSRKIFAKANLFWEPCIRGSCHRRERAIPLPPRPGYAPSPCLRPAAGNASSPCLRPAASLMPLPRARPSSPPVPVRPLPRARPSSPPCPSVLSPVPVCPRPFPQKIKKEQARLPALFYKT